MSLCRTPVQIKTAKARKIDGKNAVESANIRAIGDGLSGRHPSEVVSAIADSHVRIEARRVQKLGETIVAFDLFKTTGNIGQFLEAMSELPAMPYVI